MRSTKVLTYAGSPVSSAWWLMWSARSSMLARALSHERSVSAMTDSSSAASGPSSTNRRISSHTADSTSSTSAPADTSTVMVPRPDAVDEAHRPAAHGHGRLVGADEPTHEPRAREAAEDVDGDLAGEVVGRGVDGKPERDVDPVVGHVTDPVEPHGLGQRRQLRVSSTAAQLDGRQAVRSTSRRRRSPPPGSRPRRG